MITILSQPSTYLQSAGNNSVFTISSSNYLAPNVQDWQAIANIYVNGVLATTQNKFSYPGFPGNAVFNLNEIMPSFVSYNFPHVESTSSLFYTASNSSCQVQVFFGEQYSMGGNFTQSLNLASSSVFSYFNGSLSYVDSINKNLSSYLITSVTSSTQTFLTNSTSSILTYSNLRNHLYYYISSSTSTVLDIKTYDISNNPIGQYYIGNSLLPYNGVQIVSTGYPQLSSLTQGTGSNQYTVISGPATMFTSSVASYTCQLQGAGNVPFSQVVSYTIAYAADRWAPYAMNCYFLNELGGFDAYKFQKKNQKSFTKTTATYKKLPGSLRSGGQFKFNTYDRQDTNFFTAIDSTIELNSDWLTDIEVVTIQKALWSSPVIYLEDNAGVLVAANVQEDSFKVNVKEIEKMYQATFTMQLSNTDYRQQL